MAKLYVNVHATIDVMVEVDDMKNPTCSKLQEVITERDVEKHLENPKVWKHVSTVRVDHWVRE